MGQSPSTIAGAEAHQFRFVGARSAAPLIPTTAMNRRDIDVEKTAHPDDVINGVFSDYISNIPDECLGLIFQYLNSGDRRSCSLVSRRWLWVEGQSRNRLSLDARDNLSQFVPSIFNRYDAVTKLVLKCKTRSTSINDATLISISFHCRQLTRLKLRACREITDPGIAEFSKNCKNLQKLSCSYCNFGCKGLNAVLDNCPALEELSVKRLKGMNDGAAVEPIGHAMAASSLKVIILKDLTNGLSFGPMIMGAENLRTLKLFSCPGNWDRVLDVIAKRATGLVDLHLERVQVSDVGLRPISSCLNLEILQLVKLPECTNDGLKAVAEHCKLLRKLQIDGWKTNRIGDEGLIAVGKNCPKLQELVLIGVNPTRISLEKLATGCPNLERLALCGSETVGDSEISCIAEKCIALKKLCIKSCPVSDHGMEALAGGCPNLVKVKVKKCRKVTSEGAECWRASRGSVAVNLETTEQENMAASAASEGGAQGGGVENQQVEEQVEGFNITSGSSRRSTSLKARLRYLPGKRLVSNALKKWSSFGGSSRNN